MFSKITKDILNKTDDEDLINRSKSIKLGYNNNNFFKNDDQNIKAILKKNQIKSECINTNINNQSGENQYFYQNGYYDMRCCIIF
jgi:hypothetical protein